MDKFGDKGGPESNKWCASGGHGCKHHETTEEGRELYAELKQKYYDWQDAKKEDE